MYEYVNRIVAYRSWSVIPFPKWVIRNQIEACRHRLTVEPWKQTNVDFLGSRHLCACGRWCGQIVTPPLRSITSSSFERRRSLCPGSDIRQMVDRIQKQTNDQYVEIVQDYHEQKMALDYNYNKDMEQLFISYEKEYGNNNIDPVVLSEAKEQLIKIYETKSAKMHRKLESRKKNITSRSMLAISRVESEQPVIYNHVPTRRSARAATSGKFTVPHTGSTSATMGRAGGGGNIGSTHGASSIGGGGGAAMAMLDESDVRYNVVSCRWNQSDWMQRDDQETVTTTTFDGLVEPVFPNKDEETTVTSIAGHKQGLSHSLKRSLAFISGESQERRRRDGASVMVIPDDSEVLTRDVHPSIDTCVIGDPLVAFDQGKNICSSSNKRMRLVSNDKKNAYRYCKSQVFRINLIGQAVRPKGPKAQQDGPWFTLCATCGCLTTLDLYRWNDRGPSCGAHGRPHRLLDRQSPYDPDVDGESIFEHAITLAGLACVHSSSKNMELFLQPASDIHILSSVFKPSKPLAQRLEEDLRLLNIRSGLPCPDVVPFCWFCWSPADRRPTFNKSSSSSRRRRRKNTSENPMSSNNNNNNNNNKKKNNNKKNRHDESHSDVIVEASGCVFTNGGPSDDDDYEIENQHMQEFKNAIDSLNPRPLAARYQPGTSVSSAVAGSSGSVIFARSVTRGNTHQAAPVRRVNIRNSMLGPTGVPATDGGSLVSCGGTIPGEYLQDAGAHGCATNGCSCELEAQLHLRKKFEEHKEEEVLENHEIRYYAEKELLKQREKIQRKHATISRSRILPIELLPSVGEEICILVLDDTNDQQTQHFSFRWIYLCPTHMKYLRMGWVALKAKFIQIDKNNEAATLLKKLNGNIDKIKDTVLFRAAKNQQIGREAVIKEMFNQTLKLSDVLHAINRGSKTVFKQQMKFRRGIPGTRRVREYKLEKRDK